LQAIHLTNLQDINKVIDEAGLSLRKGFYGITVPMADQQVTDGITPASQLTHSISNTSRATIKVVYFHSNVFISGKLPGISRQNVDNCSPFAINLLSIFNPQDGKLAAQKMPKRFRSSNLMYTRAVQSIAHRGTAHDSLSTITHINELFEAKSQCFEDKYETKMSI